MVGLVLHKEMIYTKIKITNKKLWANYTKPVSISAGIISFILAFIDLNQCTRITIGFIYIIFLLIMFLRMLYKANKETFKKLRINDTDVKIVFGDIFAQNGIKVIAFNEYFDTQVDDRIISETSLNGQYILHHSNGKKYIDTVIDKEKHLEEAIVERHVIRKQGGKQIKYRLGTICPIDDYFIMSFTHFDENDKAYLSLEDYISCLMHMWTELDYLYAGKPINITLLGSGITRFNNYLISEQELLHLIVRTFEISKIKFGNKSSLTILLDKRIEDKINLYNIVKEK